MFPIFILTIENAEDRSFAEEIYVKNKHKIYKAVYKILHNEQDAEDATAETFEKIINNLQNYYNKSDDELTSIFITIAKRTATDKYRRNNNIKFVPIDEIVADENNNADEVGDFTIKSELFEMLYNNIDMLEMEDSQIVKFKLGYEYSDKEIGEILGISAGNVRIRYHRAKKRLFECMKGYVYI